ncbi:hypothetical protein FI667_g1313, partial [Globisporangium splendens]
MQRSMRQSVRAPQFSMQQREQQDVLPMELYRNARSGAIERHSQRQQQRSSRDELHETKVTEEDEDPPSPRNQARVRLIERMRTEKNRVVQRCLVACRLTEPSRDLLFNQKKKDFAAAIERLQTTKQTIQQFTIQVQRLVGAVTSFAGDASSNVQASGQTTSSNPTFLQVSQQIEEAAYLFADEVHETIIAKVNARIVVLEKMHMSIIERGNLQLDVDYAKRKVCGGIIGVILTIAHQKRDVNQIAERKHALQVAQKHCAIATKAITEQLQHVDANQQPEIKELLTQFSQLLMDFFQTGDALLAQQSSLRSVAAPIAAGQGAEEAE